MTPNNVVSWANAHGISGCEGFGTSVNDATWSSAGTFKGGMGMNVSIATVAARAVVSVRVEAVGSGPREGVAEAVGGRLVSAGAPGAGFRVSSRRARGLRRRGERSRRRSDA